jgi:aarF domain-containing kinase
LNHIVPRQYTDTLVVLTDKAPFMSADEVHAVLSEELGRDWRMVFSSFDEVPIAAASLAQVHRARLLDGSEVAVKIQFPSVRKQLQLDLATITLSVHIVGRLFPKWQFAWILPEFRTYLAQELDFELEARNNERISAMFSADPQFATPKVYRDFSTRRLLVMEFIDGCKVNDVKTIRSYGFEPSEVASLLLRNFADQVFVGGIFA